MESLTGRFIFSIVLNVVRAALIFILQTILARTLGPESFGLLNFLLAVSISVGTLLDGGTSSAFFTFISQKNRGWGLYVGYAVWLCAQPVLLILLMYNIPDVWFSRMWHGNDLQLVTSAIIFSFFLNQFWVFIAQIGESIKDTVSIQLRNIIHSTLILICVLSLILSGSFSVIAYMTISSVLYFTLGVAYLWSVHRRGKFRVGAPEDAGSLIRQSLAYCGPLAGINILFSLYNFLEPWMLQQFAGSVAQGLYSISYRYSYICLLLTTSISQTFWSEISRLFGTGDIKRAGALFFNLLNLIGVTTGILACGISVYASEIIQFSLGKSFDGAWLPLTIMFLYPIHNSMNAFSDLVLLATHRSKIKGWIGVVFVFLSISLTYFLIAPSDFLIGGLSLGATGFAIKMLLAQAIQTNLSAFYACKALKVPFNWGIQGVIFFVLLPWAFLTKWIGMMFFADTLFVVRLIFSTTLYLSAAWFFAKHYGVQRQLQEMKSRFMTWRAR